jgi:mannan endo-1,4-beta-mannosidase
VGLLVVRRRAAFVGFVLIVLALALATPGLLRGDDVDAAASRYLARDGTRLVHGGRTYRSVGLDAYELATRWGTNAGCGGMLDDDALDRFFAGLPPRTLVRIWGFQASMATEPSTGARVWAPLDRVVEAAERHHQLLIVSLTDQGGTCDDHRWKDPEWYRGGYRNVDTGIGAPSGQVAYLDWVREIVTRYRSSTAIAMWEPVNEPEASECNAGSCAVEQRTCHEAKAAAALRAFFDVVGREIRRLDPNHLVESGALGGPQCGWTGSHAARIHASRGIDVTSYHDYHPEHVVPRDLRTRLREAARLEKPLLVGELGMRAGSGCISTAQRAARINRKVDAMLRAGATGVLVWSWVPHPQRACTYDVGPGDPLLDLLRRA